MKHFFALFFSILDKEDKKSFPVYVVVLFLGSTFSILGIGAVIPLVKLLVEPKQLETIRLLHGMSYQTTVIALTITLIVAYAVKNLVTFLLVMMQSKFLYSIVKKIQVKLFEKYIYLPYAAHLSRETPDLVKNINNETDVLCSYVISPFGMTLIESFSSFFVFCFLLFVSPYFTLAVGTALAIGLFLFFSLIKRKMAFHSQARTHARSLLIGRVIAALKGLKETKLYHCEAQFSQRFNVDAERLKSAGTYQYAFAQAPRMLIEFIGIMVVMSVTSVFILLGTPPEKMYVLLGVFGVAAAQLLPSLNRLTQAIVQIKYGFAALEIISTELNDAAHSLPKTSELLNTENKSNAIDISTFKHLSTRDVCYRYPDGTLALKGVSLDITKGQHVALVGRSGAGKTTFVDLLMGLYRPNSGKIILDGIAIDTDFNWSMYQRLFAYIPQQVILYNQTVRENIAFGFHPTEIDDTLVADVLEKCCLTELVAQLPNKAETLLGEDGVRLSGGQRQRIGLARALYRKPQILVMDEATSALDNETEQAIVSMLTEEHPNFTLITIAHRISSIKNYDLICFFSDGKIAATGDFGTLLREVADFRHMASLGEL